VFPVTLGGEVWGSNFSCANVEPFVINVQNVAFNLQPIARKTEKIRDYFLPNPMRIVLCEISTNMHYNSSYSSGGSILFMTFTLCVGSVFLK